MKRETLIARLVAMLIVFPLAVTVVLAQGRRQTEMGDSVSPSVAIFHFINVSTAPEDEWIGAGIAETIAAEFESLEDLRVIRRGVEGESIFDLSAEPGTEDFAPLARQRSQQLGADWFVIGGYQRFIDQLRIIARVINTETGRIGRVVKVDGAVVDIFQLQDEVVAELQNGLSDEILGRSEVATNRVRETPSEGGVNRGRERRSGDSNRLPSQADVIGDIERENIDSAREGGGAIPAARSLAGRATITIPRIDQPPNIDGVLDDAVWAAAVHLTDFVQQQPLEGAPATEATDVYIAYDSDNIYLAVHAHYSDPNLMRANRVDRDQAFSDDKVRIYFDPFLDQQRAYSFSVNGYGVQGDAIIDASGRGGGGGRGRGGGGGRRGGGGDGGGA